MEERTEGEELAYLGSKRHLTCRSQRWRFGDKATMEYSLEIKHKQRCKSKEGMMLNSDDHRKDTIE